MCQTADCAPVLGMPAQGCAVDSECRGTGFTCQPNALLDALEPGAKTCTAPASGDGGATTDSGTTTDAAPVTDAAPE
jgi:hypothetical protein